MSTHTFTFRERIRVERVVETGLAVMARALTMLQAGFMEMSMIMAMTMIMVMPRPGRAAHEETT